MNTDPLGRSDAPLSTDDGLTVAGIAPIGLETRDGERPHDPLERAALARAMRKLVPDDYRPVRLGRFVLLEPLGQGGMGVVHAGYDDTLERRVALKLINPERAASEPARRRLFREAQAMAKLSHPNVVQVFEAGEHVFPGADERSHLYIAMELVEGRTLRVWNREADRHWREVLRMYVQIGEGLAAAHDAGVVHRDFKPDNVLIGRGDRPKVADFGLANLELQLSSAADSTSSSTARSGEPDPLTVTGDVMGTPAYMPLEQFTERRCDAAGDQFSFCVALYESLYGERPFEGDDIGEIMRNVANANVRPPASRREVPGWVRAIVVRGLSPRRRHRFPDMRALVAALSHDPQQRRRRNLLRAAAIAAVLGSVAAGVWVVQTRPQPCRDAEHGLGERWGDEARAQIDAALRGTGVSFADETATRVVDTLDGWTDTWRRGYFDACEATQIRGMQSAAAMDLRMACYDHARAGLDAALAQLRTADAKVVEHAVALVDALPRLASCDDVEALRARVPPPSDPTVAAAVDELRDGHAAGHALHVAGRVDAAEAALRELQERASHIDHPSLRAEIDATLGEVLMAQAEHAEAEVVLRRAMTVALGSGDESTAIRAAATLAMLIGGRDSRFAEAEWIAEVALGLAEHHGDAVMLADAYNSRGSVAVGQARFAEAEAALRTALELLQGEVGEEHLEVAVIHENLGTTLLGLGRNEEGLAEHRRALQIREAQLGPEHPMIAIGHFNVGTSLQELGRNEESEAELRHAIELLVLAFGPNHPDAAMGYANLGIALDELGKHTAAQAEYRRSIAILGRVLGADHPMVAQGYNNLGTSFEDEGRLVEAEAEFRRALAIARRALGEAHPDVARTHGNLASVLIAQRRFDEAVAAADAALAISLDVLQAGHPDLLYAYRGVCDAELARARVRWASDRAAARVGGERAREMCEAAGSADPTLLATVRAWQAEHER